MLNKRQIYRLLSAQLVSSTGDQLTLVASFVTLYATTGDGVVAASPLLIRGIVQFVFGILSMHFVDRFKAKSIAVAADIARFILVGSIVAVKHPSIAHILSVQAFSSFVEMFFNSSREKLFNAHADKLPEQEQTSVISLDNQVLSFTEIFGFALGFLLTSGLSFRVAFGIDALTFLVSAVLILGTSDISVRSTISIGLSQISDGFRATFDSSDLRRMTLMRSLFWVGAGVFNVMVIELLKTNEGSLNPASAAGLARSLEAIGFTLGLWSISRLVSKRDSAKGADLSFLFSTCALGLGIAALTVFGLIPRAGLPILMVCFFLHGIGTGYNSFGVRRIRQIATRHISEFRGRVNALSNSIAKFCEVVGMAAVLFGSRFGGDYPQFVLGLAGVILLAATFFAGSRPQPTKSRVPADSGAPS